MIRKAMLILLLLGLGFNALMAREDKHPFERAFEAIADKEAVFRPGGEWVPHPAYNDRESWSRFFTGIKTIVNRGRGFLGRDWHENPSSLKHREALSELVLAELAEGKGQFVPEIANALKAFVDFGYLPTPGSDPSTPPEQRIIALHEAAYGAEIAIAIFFLGDVLDTALCHPFQPR